MPGFLSKRQQMGLAAIILAASAFISRLMGLIRDKVISWQFGAGPEADMYFAAFVIPDIINYLLAGGFMSITIIPLLATRFREDTEDAWRFFSCIFFWIFLASIVCTTLGFLWADSLARLVAPGFNASQCSRLAFFMRLILPAQVFFLSGACFTALLFLRRQFSVPALTPLIYNATIILCGLLLPLLYSRESAERDAYGMTGFCIGVSFGAALGAFLLPLLVAAKSGLKLSLVCWHPLLKKFLFIALPLMLGQTVVMLDEQFLRVFGSLLDSGSVSLLNYARRIAQVPVGLMGQAMAVASYPFLVQLLSEGKSTQFSATLRKALMGGLALIIPCAGIMLACAWPILGIIFQGGRFGLLETNAATPLTQLMLAVTPFWVLYMVLVRAFYAHGDTITPALTGTVVTIFCIPVYYCIAVPQGVWAIALVSGISIAFYVVWLMLIWIKRHGTEAFSGLARLSFRALSCTLPPTFLAWLLTDWLLRYFLAKELPPLLAAFCVLAVGSIVFTLLFAILAAWFAPEIWHNMRSLVDKIFPGSGQRTYPGQNHSS